MDHGRYRFFEIDHFLWIFLWKFVPIFRFEDFETLLGRNIFILKNSNGPYSNPIRHRASIRKAEILQRWIRSEHAYAGNVQIEYSIVLYVTYNLIYIEFSWTK